MNLEEQQPLIQKTEEAPVSADSNQEKKPFIGDEKYQQFAASEKAQWAEVEANPLVEAEYAKRHAEANLESEKQSFERYCENAEDLRLDIDEKKSRWLTRILEFRQIQTLERDLGVVERSRDSAEKMVLSREELLAAYDRISAEQQELGGLMEEAYRENAEWDENKRLEFLEEEKNRDVDNLTRAHGTYFVHDIVDAEWKPSANNQAIDTKSLNWEDQLDILTGLQPSISTSTLDKGSVQRTFGGNGSWGALISGGRIVGGGKSDIGSVAVGLRDRRVVSRQDASVEAVTNAVTKREGTSYNELIVEQPEVAGVYCRWADNMPTLTEETSLQNGGGIRYDRWWDRMQQVMDRDIPIFILDTNNEAHMIYDIDIEKRTFKVSPTINPEEVGEILGQQHRNADNEKAAVGRVFDSVSHLLTEEEKARFAPESVGGDER